MQKDAPESPTEFVTPDDLTKIEETLNTYTHLYKNALTDITSLIDDMNEARINS